MAPWADYHLDDIGRTELGDMRVLAAAAILRPGWHGPMATVLGSAAGGGYR